MKTLLAVSPHLDDAIFSAGAYLARRAAAGRRVVVATCFTASVPNPQGFALACQLDKGLGPEVDYMALRRAEDEAACSVIGAEPVHLPFAEAPHRGYGSAPALFGPKLDSDDVGHELAGALRDLIAQLEPDELLGPLCVGDHVDHRAVRDALKQIARQDTGLWADLPYAARIGSALPADMVPHAIGAEFELKLEAACKFRTQLGFQFGEPSRMAGLLGIGGNELFWTDPDCPADIRH